MRSTYLGFTIVLILIQVIFSFSLFETSQNLGNNDPALYLVRLTDPHALCLDGSPGSYYITKSGDPKKIYLEFEGGGWCEGPSGTAQTIQSCYQRSKTGFGSSKNYSHTVIIDDGVLSMNPLNNFRNWTKVALKYCDGSGHQGTRANPISYKGTKLYFRGHNITVAQLDDVERTHKIFSEATHIVVGGNSAGGLAAFTWANYIKERAKVAKVWAFPDSGIFLDSVNVTSGRHDYKNSFKNLVSLVNAQIENPATECVQKYPNEPENCMFAQNLAPFLRVPLFVLQSLYDTWSIENILNIKCIKDDSLFNCTDQQVSHIEEYHRNMTNAIFAMGANSINGFWAPVCSIHVFTFCGAYYNSDWRIPMNSQNSIAKSVQGWLDNGDQINNKFIDLGKWPDNRPCAGKTESKNLRMKHKHLEQMIN